MDLNNALLTLAVIARILTDLHDIGRIKINYIFVYNAMESSKENGCLNYYFL